MYHNDLTSLRHYTYLKYSSFLPGNLLDCIPKDASVVNAQRGNATHPRPPVGAHARARTRTTQIQGGVSKQYVY